MSNEKVSLRNLKEYIKEKPKNTKKDSSTTARDKDLLKRIEQRLNQDLDLDLEVSLFESKLRLLLIHAMEERDKNKRLQQLNLLTPTKTTN